MKHLLFACFLAISFLTVAQWKDNTTPTYPELIEIYKELDAAHAEIELYQMGESDYGLPIYVVLINGADDSTASFLKVREGSTLLMTNGCEH